MKNKYPHPAVSNRNPRDLGLWCKILAYYPLTSLQTYYSFFKHLVLIRLQFNTSEGRRKKYAQQQGNLTWETVLHSHIPPTRLLKESSCQVGEWVPPQFCQGITTTWQAQVRQAYPTINIQHPNILIERNPNHISMDNHIFRAFGKFNTNTGVCSSLSSESK